VVIGEQVDYDEDDFPLGATLVGGAVGYAGAIAWAVAGNDIDQSRANVINLIGFAGAAIGFGTSVLVGVDEGDTALILAGAGSLGAKVLGTLITAPSVRGSGSGPDEGKPQLLGLLPTYHPGRGAGLEVSIGF
jgi:hypothetical protein